MHASRTLRRGATRNLPCLSIVRAMPRRSQWLFGSLACVLAVLFSVGPLVPPMAGWCKAYRARRRRKSEGNEKDFGDTVIDYLKEVVDARVELELTEVGRGASLTLA